jgi:hypothetical protein
MMPVAVAAAATTADGPSRRWRSRHRGGRRRRPATASAATPSPAPASGGWRGRRTFAAPRHHEQQRSASARCVACCLPSSPTPSPQPVLHSSSTQQYAWLAEQAKVEWMDALDGGIIGECGGGGVWIGGRFWMEWRSWLEGGWNWMEMDGGLDGNGGRGGGGGMEGQRWRFHSLPSPSHTREDLSSCPTMGKTGLLYRYFTFCCTVLYVIRRNCPKFGQNRKAPPKIPTLLLPDQNRTGLLGKSSTI